MHINISTLLDVAIGLIFIFFVFSIFVSGIVELINSLIEQRAKLLRLALGKLLGKALSKEFFEHQLTEIKQEHFAGFRKPISYLSAESFSTVLIDLLTRSAGGQLPSDLKPTEQTFEKIKQLSNQSDAGKYETVIKLIQPILAKSDNFNTFQTELEKWYNGYMEQVSGWFKRYVQGVLRLVALVVTLLLNVDTIHLTNQLFNDNGLRDRLVDAAVKTTADGGASFKKDTAFVSQLARYDSSLVKKDSLNSSKIQIKPALTGADSLVVQAVYVDFVKGRVADLKLPIGWVLTGKQGPWLPGQDHGVAFLGWLLTAAALSFGAPFWFDLLLKLVNIRNTARRPSGNTGSSN
ncbi:hypothetical protein [Spirosoma fluviale]|uniref:Uncharacterized protein n=1 Tax=Spirosoma fluviale TaxID=1597977 RepID=A0A286F980_9BACT|nr:hypothetical protein [Spirosoma fluviale]SOD79636.1 hypothetical protein SAMN06269250_1026 [Spirosoma fluviale]